MTDHAALLAGCAGGDRQALRALFEAEGPRMTGVARRILRRHDLAEEAVQDAFVAVWQKAAQYDPARGAALGWIYAVLRNRALNMLRNSAREDLTAPEDIDAARESAPMEDPADEAWERLDASSRLRACLEALDPLKRRCVLMAYVLGFTHGEIAGRLATPLGTVKAWVRRGLGSLRECMS